MKGLMLAIIMMVPSLNNNSMVKEAERVKTSVVSFYHDNFNGKKTASGEKFDNSDLTAASKTLPFGTRVKVTNVTNGKSVIVRVNDRGPYVKNRALDLSKEAFRQIANTGRGLVKITYEVLTDND